LSEQQERTQQLNRVAGAIGIVASTLPLAMILASTFLEKSFSWNKNALSHIGVSQLAWLFNSALVIGGFLNLLFAVGLRRYLNKTRRVKDGASLLIVSSISLTLVGVFTENYALVHALVALGYLLLAPLGVVLIGLGEKRRTIGKLSLVLGVIALLSLLILPGIVFGLNLQVGFAIPELLESLVLSAWTICYSLELLRVRAAEQN
jgi:hypothetical membrane protein